MPADCEQLALQLGVPAMLAQLFNILYSIVELKFFTVWADVLSTTKRRITTVNRFFDIFHFRRYGMKSIFDFFIIVCKDSL